MSDMGEVWREERQRSQKKRAVNRKSSADILCAAGIPFASRNGGAHLVVEHAGIIVDFWPGTGLWKNRESGRMGRGVKALIIVLKK